MQNQSFTSARRALAEKLSLFLNHNEANAESWRWFEEGLGWGRARIIAHGEELVTEDIENQLAVWLDRRARGEPWAYILGWTTWRGRRFNVTPATLIPRPETEFVLESAIELAVQIGARRVVDVGAGAGILAVTLALETNLDVTATDISPKALAAAKQNAREHGVNITWLSGDLLASVPDPVDLVVSNPPYVDPKDKATLQRELFFEPAEALFAPDRGLEVITRLLEQCFERKARGLVIEIGSGQGDELSLRASKIGWQVIEIKQDTAKHDRVLVARAIQ
ncbi:MAG: peptide chain release factor N(5)-glutamine methyltransferase [Holophagales bacterium]|nr:peptide chain release factor N(5)-glutamine methyltransferase [Holophagales bacterium]